MDYAAAAAIDADVTTVATVVRVCEGILVAMSALSGGRRSKQPKFWYQVC